MTLWLLGLVSGLALALGALTLWDGLSTVGVGRPPPPAPLTVQTPRQTSPRPARGDRGEGGPVGGAEGSPLAMNVGRGTAGPVPGARPRDADPARPPAAAPPARPGASPVQASPPETAPMAATAETPAPPEEPRVTEVWRPFNSERTAQAFARRLSLAAGVDLRVIGHDRDGYHVGLRHRDAAELAVLIARIEQRTGLRLETRP